MKKPTIVATLLLVAASCAFGHNSLKVINPDWWWAGSGEDGTIEEAVFTVEPKGIYTEVGMYLTISAKGLGYSNADSLEIVFDFSLPQGAIVHDSWLWVGDVIVKADIIDRWTAIETYENIVDRRRDPSLLYRKPLGGYQLRVYPLPGDESRKIKITWLTPTRWTAATVSTMLPIDLLQASLFEPDKIQLVTLPNADWQNPKLVEHPSVNFQAGNDAVWGDFLYANLDWEAASQPLTFQVEAPLQNGVFASRLDDGDGRFYQLAYFPPYLPQVETPRKIAFLFDHETQNTSVGGKELFAFLKRNLPDYLTANDQFNMFFSREGFTQRLSDDWLPADSATLQQVLGPIQEPIWSEASLWDLISDAFDFVHDNGGVADIVLFVSSNDYNPWGTGGILAELLLNEASFLSLDVTIHVVNFQDKNLWYESTTQDGDAIYTVPQAGIYETLTAETGGNLYGMPSSYGNFWETTLNVLDELTFDPAVFSLNTDLANGFTWQPYLVQYLGQSTNINRPVLQVGRYEGDFPMEIEFSAVTTNGIYSESKTLEADQIMEADSLEREAWFGNHLSSLEGGNPNEFQIQDIIELSIAERVLCSFTAFLALEPNQGGEPCLACWETPNDDGGIIQTEEKIQVGGWSVSASPNPFDSRVRIKLTNVQQISLGKINLSIYDVHGRLVRQLETFSLQNGEVIEVEWDGLSQDGQPLPAGIYYATFLTEAGPISCKLVKIS